MAAMVTVTAAVVAMATAMTSVMAATTAVVALKKNNFGNSDGRGAQTTINYKGLGRN